MDDNFGVLLDMEYSDGSFCYGQVLQFPTGTTSDWIYSDQVFQLPKAAVSLNVTILMREHSGAGWIDHIYVSIIHPRETTFLCNTGLYGNSRIKTLSDSIYSFQTPGEYTLFTVCCFISFTLFFFTDMFVCLFQRLLLLLFKVGMLLLRMNRVLYLFLVLL